MKKKIFTRAGFVFLLFMWLGWDVYQANIDGYRYISAFPAAQSKTAFVPPANIAVVRADDPALAHPGTMTDNPSDTTVLEMVRRAVNLMGGFGGKIQGGMTVLIKPNIVEQQPSGSGNVTDVRVVEAVVRLVDEIDHGNIAIIVGDGSPRPFTTFEKSQSSGKTPWVQLFDVPGYPALKTRMLAAGINFRISNLNGNSDTNPVPELVEANVPGGGQAQPQQGKYFVHQEVVNADVYITVPVMKVHDPGMTCVLKNQVGIASSAIYGFSKTAGTPRDNYRHKLVHFAQMPYAWSDKEIVDLCAIAKIKFVIVDALMCLDLQKTIMAGNANQVRMNTIVAGTDPVAADHVCARLMGMNPDDMEHITLAERVGLGTNDPAKITVLGADIEATKKKFRKNPTVETQKFGQGNREWLLTGIFPLGSISNPIDYPFIQGEAALAPLPGSGGWSGSTYFINDRVNLKDYYTGIGLNANSAACYAFAYFNAPAAGEAELWVGSDEALKIWLNGNVVYKFDGVRTFANTSLLSEKKRITVQQGVNRLLVKTLQNVSNSYFDFSLNICAVDTNQYYAGSRIWGLKFFAVPNATGVKKSTPPSSFLALTNYPNPFNPSTRFNFSIPERTHVTLDVFDLSGQKIRTLINREMLPGEYEQDFHADNLPAGIYLCCLAAGKYSASRKIILVK